MDNRCQLETAMLRYSINDMSAAKLRYRLGWLALCEGKDNFYEEAPRALRSGELKIQDLDELPIFDDIRNDARFTKLLSRSKKFKKAPAAK